MIDSTNNSSSTITNLVVLATLSSTALSVQYESNENLIPDQDFNFGAPTVYLENWKDQAFNTANYIISDENTEKTQIVLDFSEKILNESKELDNEFADLVNENFWDLI